MSLRRTCLEALVRGISWCARPVERKASASLKSIIVLRNNDIGDLLVVTPLFEALKKTFPLARIIAGIGRWNKPVLEQNPWVDQILEINAPWHNKQVCPYPNNSARGLIHSLRYILRSTEAVKLAQAQCDVGIDVLGSPEGSLLLVRAGIPTRLGVKGYAGGDSAVQKYVTYNHAEHVGRSALRFAELLGARDLPECRPQLYLTESERKDAEQCWLDQAGRKTHRRLLVAPGGVFLEKCWPLEHFTALADRLAAAGGWQLIVVGGPTDISAGKKLAAIAPGILDLTGKLSLRQTFALMERGHLAVCNSSMLMHVAAAFKKPALVLLGESFLSTQQHAAQWGYPEQVFLGREGAQKAIGTVDEAMAALGRLAR
jgi:heptosyltransferase-2